MTIRYVDIHSHLNLSQFDEDRDHIAQEMYKLGVASITVGTNTETSDLAITLAEKHNNLFACVGMHPVDNPGGLVNVQALEQQVVQQRVVCVGETGLDYFRRDKDVDYERQYQNFIQQITIAVTYDKPLMLHIRPSEGTTDAYDDVLAVLRELKSVHGDKLRGNAHFFAGTVAQALAFNELGFTVSFTGVITFTHDYDAVVQAVPIEMMHAETDAPFVAPVPYRGQRCTPLHVLQVYEAIARIKNLDPEQVRQQLVHNAVRDFGIIKS